MEELQFRLIRMETFATRHGQMRLKDTHPVYAS